MIRTHEKAETVKIPAEDFIQVSRVSGISPEPAGKLLLRQDDFHAILCFARYCS
jgi:hypothetical protein